MGAIKYDVVLGNYTRKLCVLKTKPNLFFYYYFIFHMKTIYVFFVLLLFQALGQNFCIFNSNHGCCCTNIGAFCNLGGNSGYSSTVINSTIQVFDNTYHGHILAFQDTSSNFVAIDLQFLSEGLWFGFWKITMCSDELQWEDIFYVAYNNSVCSIPFVKENVAIFG